MQVFGAVLLSNLTSHSHGIHYKYNKLKIIRIHYKDNELKILIVTK